MADQLTKQDLIEALAVFKQEFKTELTASLKTELTATLTTELTASLKTELTAWLEVRQQEERTYYRQLLHTELASIREQLARIEQTIGEDAKHALLEIDQLTVRVSALETHGGALQAA